MAVERPPTAREALQQAVVLFDKAGIDTPQLDAEILLAHELGIGREKLLADLDRSLTPSEDEGYRALIARRDSYEPLAYITGHKEFFGLDFVVNSAVLIPRPETETLVEVALAVAKQKDIRTIADIGVGSGAVAVALAKHLPQARIFASDVSSEALEVAAENCRRHEIAEQMILLQGDLLEPLEERVGFIIANLPYLTDAEMAALPPDVANYEPREALSGGVDGLLYLRRIIKQAPDYLDPEGGLALEIGPTLAKAVAELARPQFPHAQIALVKDLAGLERVLLVLAILFTGF